MRPEGWIINEDASPRRVVYCRLPGLLAHVAAQAQPLNGATVPLVVAEKRVVRDASLAAIAAGAKAGQSVTSARRFCPAVLVVPLSAVEYRATLRILLETLSDVSPIVEPLEPDGAYADLTACGGTAQIEILRSRIQNVLPFVSIVIGEGKSRLAARAVAECGVSSERLGEVAVQWLCEEAALTARLSRLGLTTFGAVAELPESFLVYQFGKVGRLLHQRAQGNDFTPIKPLYPLPRVDLRRDFSMEPIDDKLLFHTALLRLVEEASRQLKALGRYGRRVRVWLRTEQEECQREAILATPVQETVELASVARRLSEQLRVSAAIVGLRLLVEDLDVPAAATHSLFEEREAKSLLRLEAMKRRLVARYGRHSLMHLRDIPIPIREERRTLVHEMRGGV